MSKFIMFMMTGQKWEDEINSFLKNKKLIKWELIDGSKWLISGMRILIEYETKGWLK